jgi:hypothetical protein
MVTCGDEEDGLASPRGVEEIRWIGLNLKFLGFIKEGPCWL